MSATATARAREARIEPQVVQQQTPTQEQIAVRAYELWEARGCPTDSSEEDWFTAEAQLTEIVS